MEEGNGLVMLKVSALQVKLETKRGSKSSQKTHSDQPSSETDP